jgi:hypothetical protein
MTMLPGTHHLVEMSTQNPLAGAPRWVMQEEMLKLRSP